MMNYKQMVMNRNQMMIRLMWRSYDRQGQAPFHYIVAWQMVVVK